MLRFLTILPVSILLLAGCKEIGPDVRFGPPTGLGDRVVLIEEFTGVQCVFCPPGTEELENLLLLYPDNLAVVSIHTGFFATPVPNKSKEDFRTPEGDALNVFLGSPDKGYPSSIINRRRFPGETSLHNVQSKWAAYVAEEAGKEAPVGLTLTPVFDPASRKLSVQVSGIARQNVDSPLRMTVMVTESGMVDLQKDIRYGDVENYTHKHVLRGMLNNSTEGDLVAPNGVRQGETLNYSAERVLPENWKPEKLQIIAFLTEGPTKYVIQAAKAYLPE